MWKASGTICVCVCVPLRNTWESACRVMRRRSHPSLSVLAGGNRCKPWKCLMNVLFSAGDWLPLFKQQTAPLAKYSGSRYCTWLTQAYSATRQTHTHTQLDEHVCKYRHKIIFSLLWFITKPSLGQDTHWEHDHWFIFFVDDKRRELPTCSLPLGGWCMWAYVWTCMCVSSCDASTLIMITLQGWIGCKRI